VIEKIATDSIFSYLLEASWFWWGLHDSVSLFMQTKLFKVMATQYYENIC